MTYIPQDELQKYFRRFGHDKTTDPLKSAQAFLGVPVDGDYGPVTELAVLSPRCGLPDIVAASASTCKWATKDIAYGFMQFLPEEILSKADQLAMTRDMHQIIGGVCGLRAVYTDDYRDAQVVYTWRRGSRSNFDGPGRTLAYAYLSCGVNASYKNGGRDAAGLVAYDGDEQWAKEKRPGRGRIRYFNVGFHETLHAHGVPHCQQQPDGENIMEAIYSEQVDYLGRWDKEQLVLRYGQPTTVPTPPTPAPPTGENRVPVRLKVGEQVYSGWTYPEAAALTDGAPGGF